MIVNIVHQTNLVRQVASPQDPKQTDVEERDEVEKHANIHIVTTNIVSHQGEKDEDIPQWLKLNFEKKKKIELPNVTL